MKYYKCMCKVKLFFTFSWKIVDNSTKYPVILRLSGWPDLKLNFYINKLTERGGVGVVDSPRDSRTISSGEDGSGSKQRGHRERRTKRLTDVGTKTVTVDTRFLTRKNRPYYSLWCVERWKSFEKKSKWLLLSPSSLDPKPIQEEVTNWFKSHYLYTRLGIFSFATERKIHTVYS